MKGTADVYKEGYSVVLTHMWMINGITRGVSYPIEEI